MEFTEFVFYFAVVVIVATVIIAVFVCCTLGVIKFTMFLDDKLNGRIVRLRHSRWLKCDYSSEYYCEECGCAFKIPCYVRGDYEYCPKCGARMRKENENA